MPKPPSSSHAGPFFPDSVLFPSSGIGTSGIGAPSGICSSQLAHAPSPSPLFDATAPHMSTTSHKTTHAPPLPSSPYSAALLLDRNEKTADRKAQLEELSSLSLLGCRIRSSGWEDSVSTLMQKSGSIIRADQKLGSHFPVQEYLLGRFHEEELIRIPVKLELGDSIHVGELGGIHAEELGGIHAEESGGILMEGSGGHAELAFERKYLDSGVLHPQSSGIYLPIIRSDIGHADNSTLASRAVSYSAPSSPPSMANSDYEQYCNYYYSAVNAISSDRNAELHSDRLLPSPRGETTATLTKKAPGGQAHQPRFAFRTRTDIDILDDGYKWRKYGQKAVKNNANPRSYYRCTHIKCNVKKRVERLAEDRGIVVTSYQGIHNHYTRETAFNYMHPIFTNYTDLLQIPPPPCGYHSPLTTNIPDTLNHLFTTHHT